jgi:hypothetical protein
LAFFDDPALPTYIYQNNLELNMDFQEALKIVENIKANVAAGFVVALYYLIV